MRLWRDVIPHFRVKALVSDKRTGHIKNVVATISRILGVRVVQLPAVTADNDGLFR